MLGSQRWRRTQHDAVKEGKLARGGEEFVGALVLSRHDDLRTAQAQVKCVEQREMRIQIFARARSHAFE